MTDAPTVTVAVTGFKITTHGVTVTATRVGDYWSFEWPGRNRDDKAMVWCAFPAAQDIAEKIAEQVATEIIPLRAELHRRTSDLAEWVMAHNEEGDHR